MSARETMVVDQLMRRSRGITDSRVLLAMKKVPRHEFVPEVFRKHAYEDRPLPIGYDQTISQPYVVAFMTEQLNLKPTDRVLEIGTGSGYQTALLAELAGEVFSIEIVRDLAEPTAALLRKLGYAKIHLRVADGSEGWPEAAPFDAIIGTCAPEAVPQPLMEQLKDGGRMVIPVGGAGKQELIVLAKQGGVMEQRAVLQVHFVPMTRLE